MKVKVYVYDTHDGSEKLAHESRYLDEAFEEFASVGDKDGDGCYNAAVRHLEREGRFWISSVILFVKL